MQFPRKPRTGPSGETPQGRGADDPTAYIPPEVQSEINALDVDGLVEPPSGRNVGGIGSISRRPPRFNDDVTILTPGETYKIPLPKQYNQNPVATRFRLKNEAQQQAKLDEIIAKQRGYEGEPTSIIIPQGRVWYSTSGEKGVLPELTQVAGVFRDLEEGLPARNLRLGDNRLVGEGRKGQNSRTPDRYTGTVNVNSPNFRKTFFDQGGRPNQDRVDLFIDAVNELGSETWKRKWRPTFGDPSDLSAPKGATELAPAAVFELPIVDQDGKAVMTRDPQTGQLVPKTRRFSADKVLGVEEIPDQTASFLSQKPITLGGMIKDLVNEYTTEVRPAALINSIKRMPTKEERAIYGHSDGTPGAFVGMIDRKGASLPVFTVKDNKDVYRIGNPTKYSPEMDYPLAELFGIEYKGWKVPELASKHVRWARTDKLMNLVKQDGENFKLYTASPGEKGVTYTELKPDQVAAELDRLQVLASQRLAELRSSSSELARKSALLPGEFSDAPVLYVKDKGGYLGRKETSIVPMSAALGSTGLLLGKMTRQFEVPALVHPDRSDIRKTAENALGVKKIDLVDEMLATRFSDPDNVSKAPYSGAREQLAFDVREFMNREGRPPTVAEQVNIARSLALRRSGGPPVQGTGLPQSRLRSDHVQLQLPITTYSARQSAPGGAELADAGVMPTIEEVRAFYRNPAAIDALEAGDDQGLMDALVARQNAIEGRTARPTIATMYASKWDELGRIQPDSGQVIDEPVSVRLRRLASERRPIQLTGSPGSAPIITTTPTQGEALFAQGGGRRAPTGSQLELPITVPVSAYRGQGVSPRSTYDLEARNAYGALLDSLLVNPEVGVLRPLRPSFARNREDLLQAEAAYPDQLAAYNAALQAAKEENYRALRVALGFPAASERPDTRVSEAAAQAAVRALDEEVGTAEHDALMRAITASLGTRQQARIADEQAGLDPVRALPLESFRGNRAAYVENLRQSYGQDPEVRALTDPSTPRAYLEQAALDVPPGVEVGPPTPVARIKAADRLLRRYAEQRRDDAIVRQQKEQMEQFGQPVRELSESMALTAMDRAGRPMTREEASELGDRLVAAFSATAEEQGRPNSRALLEKAIEEGFLDAYAQFNPNKPRMEQLNEEALRQQAGASWQPPRDDDDATTPEAFESATAAPLSRTEQYDLETSARDVVDAELDRNDLAQDVLYTDPAALQSANEERRLQRVLNKYIRDYFESVGIPGGRVPATIRLQTSAAVGNRSPFPKETLLGLVNQAMQHLRLEDPATYGMLESVPVNLRGLMRD